jgi:hypothetical protein
MKRFASLLLAVLALTIATVVAVQAQESTYPQSTTQTATDPAATTPTDPAATAPATDLPATASPMPLVALGGLAAMAVGQALSKRRKA